MASANLKEQTSEIHARDLTIVKGDDPSHWEWIGMPDTDGAQVEVAKLLEINKLDVSTTFPLAPNTKYQVEFVFKMSAGEVGFKNNPVHFKLVIPNHPTIEHQQDISPLPNNAWTTVPVRTFSTNEKDTTGDIEIRMSEHRPQKKSGIIVDKITIIQKQL